MSDTAHTSHGSSAGRASWWDRLGLRLKLQILIQGPLLVILLGAQFWLSNQIEHRTLLAAEERTMAVADGTINGLNTLMLTKPGDDDARLLFIRKMAASDNVTDLHVIRGKAVADQMGPGLPQEQAVDDVDREVLAQGKTVYRRDVNAGGDVLLRAVMPFIAMKEFRTTNCLMCHVVPEGSVLGAVSITANIRGDIEAIRRVNNWLWIGQIGLQVCLFLIVSFIARRLHQLLGAEPEQAVDLAQSVATGDLRTRMHVDDGDSQSMMAHLLAMQNSLITLVGGVRRNSESVAIASAEIAQGNNDLSARTEQQASALEQTAAAMEELGAQVKRNAETAQEANQLARTASAVAAQGGAVVNDVVHTMKGIDEASRKIADIVGVIDSIAFQTNILALNAAVEASRAGEHGRGFAVVASEVRALAGRSSEAAKEIRHLIQTSVERVGQGASLVDRAGHTMEEVVRSIQRVTDLMAEISVASSQQALGVEQVGGAVVQMDQATQQNSAMVEEIAAAAGSLKAMADELVQSVAVFKLDHNDQR